MRPSFYELAVLALALATAGVACGGGDADGAHETGEADYSLDLASYLPTQTPSALSIANQTLAFPLAVGPAAQALSETAAGDLQRVYTRVGCQIEPDAWIGERGVVPVHIPAGAPVRMIQLTVDHLANAGVSQSLDSLAAQTCVSVRVAGTWLSFRPPSRIVTTVDSAHVEFALDGAAADAASIFLPTYTYVSKITYRIARD